MSFLNSLLGFFSVTGRSRPREAEGCPKWNNVSVKYADPSSPHLSVQPPTRLWSHRMFVECLFHQLSKHRQLTWPLALHPSGIHFHSLPETSVFCSGGSFHPLLLGPTAKSLLCSYGKELCRTSLSLPLKQKTAYGGGLVWVLSFSEKCLYNISNWPQHQRRRVTHQREQQRTIKDGWMVRCQPDLGSDTTITITLKDHSVHNYTAVSWGMSSKKTPNILG